MANDRDQQATPGTSEPEAPIEPMARREGTGFEQAPGSGTTEVDAPVEPMSRQSLAEDDERESRPGD